MPNTTPITIETLASLLRAAYVSNQWQPMAETAVEWAQRANAELERLTRENTDLRELLAFRTCNYALYTDDGELTDSSELPIIDFKRFTPAQMRAAFLERGLRALRTLESQRDQATSPEQAQSHSPR